MTCGLPLAVKLRLRWLRFERHHFSGREQRDWIHCEWDHRSGNTDGRAKREFQHHLHSTIRRNASGSVTLTSNAPSPTLTIPLSGTGVAAGALGSNPSSLAFGSVTVGSKQALSETVTNTDGSNVTISQVGISGTGFTVSGITAPVTLTAGQSASFSVTFTPQSAADASGSVTLTSNAPSPTLTIPLSGTGVAPGALGSNPSSLAFGSVNVAQQSVCVRDGDQHRRFQRHHFSGRDQRDWIYREWDHCSGKTDGGAERDLHGHVHASVGWKCEWQSHSYFERPQSDP
jgi:hypothetical protein